jgi:hypothetical protein
MRMRNPRRASLDEVRISREGDTAIIENADPAVSTAHLRVGPQLGAMSDAAVLDLFNATIEAQEILGAEHDGSLTEIPPGQPQIRYMEDADQWVPRGNVLRCHIEDDEAGELVVYIDDQALSLREFGRLLTTHAGWGMRIAFVAEDRVDQEPEIAVREPDDGGK